LRQFYELLAANFKMTIRNRQALFWLFLFPVMMMGLFGIAFAGGQPEPKLGLVDLDRSEMSRTVREGFDQAKVLDIKSYRALESAQADLKDGDLDGVVVLRDGLAETVGQASRAGSTSRVRTAKIDLYFDPSNTFVSGVARGVAAGVLDEIDRAAGGTPKLLELESHSVRRRNFRYIDFLVPGIIAMTMMNSAMFGLGGTIVSYRERGILRRLKVTPQPLPVFLSAQITNQLLFSILRAVLLVAVARVFFDVSVVGSYFTLLVIIIIGSLCFVTIAFTVASVSKNREVSDSISNLITMPMMFLGGVFFPVESAPAWIQPLISALPLKYLADATRSVMIKGGGLASIGLELTILIAVTLVFFIASILMWRWE